MAKFARCSFAKITANCSNSFCHFHLISSISRPQRPLITCLYAMASWFPIWFLDLPPLIAMMMTSITRPIWVQRYKHK
jgi:hypothetical protein